MTNKEPEIAIISDGNGYCSVFRDGIRLFATGDNDSRRLLTRRLIMPERVFLEMLRAYPEAKARSCDANEPKKEKSLHDLTSEEFTIIQKRRDELARLYAARAFQRKAIKIALDFNDWSETSDENLTFSTFTNTFGYRDDDHKQMYEAVKCIFEAAWPLK
jgi:hypothetical protein